MKFCCGLSRVQEIDLHLHPLWQVEIIAKLTAIFPETQFIATSHSPLMAQVAETANYVLFRKRETDVEKIHHRVAVLSSHSGSIPCQTMGSRAASQLVG